MDCLLQIPPGPSRHNTTWHMLSCSVLKCRAHKPTRPSPIIAIFLVNILFDLDDSFNLNDIDKVFGINNNWRIITKIVVPLFAANNVNYGYIAWAPHMC